MNFYANVRKDEVNQDASWCHFSVLEVSSSNPARVDFEFHHSAIDESMPH